MCEVSDTFMSESPDAYERPASRSRPICDATVITPALLRTKASRALSRRRSRLTATPNVGITWNSEVTEP
jgi:hypothetical protein